MPSIQLDTVSVRHPDGTDALSDVSITINDGEFLGLIGPSGSGKSSVLGVIAGLIDPTSGAVHIDGHDVAHIRPPARRVAMVFQNHALYPHRTVEGNLEFPLQILGMRSEKRSGQVKKTATRVGVRSLLDRSPSTLSIGQRNATAVGRALVRSPQILLLDEPLANLDAHARQAARMQIRLKHLEAGTTTVLATNDQAEAMALSDRLVVLNRGRVQQIGSTTDLYRFPQNLFVARFLGSPSMNILTGVLDQRHGIYWVKIGDDTIRVPGVVAAHQPGMAEMVGRRVLIGFRPESARVMTTGPDDSSVSAIVLRTEDQGARVFAHLEINGGEIVASLTTPGPAPVGQVAGVILDTERLRIFDPMTGIAA